MTFRPHFLLLWHVPQTFVYLLVELFHQTFRPIKTEDEFFTCPDGGTVGIAWSYCQDGTGKPNGKHGQKPILLLAPGLGGRIDNLYTTAILVYARTRGYKVGTMYFRCCQGIPITSTKLNCAASWPDVRTIVENVYSRYVEDQKAGEKKTRLYAFGCSLGGITLGLYAGFDAEEAAKRLDGMVLYATPWNTREGCRYFRENFFGLYSYVIGIKLNEDIRKLVLPKMKHLMSEEQYQEYKEILDTNKRGLPHLDEKIFYKQYGYRDCQHFYNDVVVSDQLNKIKVPTFALGAVDD